MNLLIWLVCARSRGLKKISKLISGGQSGADRAALDFAIENGISYGGFCPKGRLAEDGIIPACYKLEEATAKDYKRRTKLNVEAADGTAVITIRAKLTRGSKATAKLASECGKPWLHLSRDVDGDAAGEKLAKFIEEKGIAVLNIAGPRQSKEPEIGQFVKQVLVGAALVVSAEAMLKVPA